MRCMCSGRSLLVCQAIVQKPSKPPPPWRRVLMSRLLNSDVEPVPWNRGFQSLGKDVRRKPANHCGNSSHPTLAYSASPPSKVVLEPPCHVGRRNPFTNPGGVGQLLQFRFHLETFSIYQVSRGRLAFLLISKIYCQMYADTGIATDSARVSWSGRWARWLAKPCRYLFAGTPMPHLKVPEIN